MIGRQSKRDMYAWGSTHIAKGLIEQRWCERPDNGHD